MTITRIGIALLTHAFLVIAGLFRAASAQATLSVAPLDSVVLVEADCGGGCPLYKGTLTSTGRTSIEPLGGADSGRIRFGAVAPESLSVIFDNARDIVFASFPDSIAGNAQLCPYPATDFSTVILTFFSNASVKTVVDYHGCFAPMSRERDSTGHRIFALKIMPALQPLRSFEAHIADTIWRTATPAKRND